MRKQTATLCLTLTIFLGSVGISEGVDLQKGLNAAQSGDFVTALSEFSPLAEGGNATTQFNLGLIYANGWGVRRDYQTALKWYRLAAEKGYADALYNLGYMYKEGYGVPQNFANAFEVVQTCCRTGIYQCRGRARHYAHQRNWSYSKS